METVETDTAQEMNPIRDDDRESCLTEMKSVLSLVNTISSIKIYPYSISIDNQGNEKINMNPTGIRLFHALVEDVPKAYQLFPKHKFHPAIEIVNECSNQIKECNRSFNDLPSTDKVRVLNLCFDRIKKRLSSDNYKLLMRRFENTRKKRKKSINNTIDLVFENFARALVLRVDLSYNPSLGIKGFKESDLKKIKNDWRKMRTDLRSEVLGLNYITSIARLEFGLKKGYHLHVLIFLDGSSHSHDISLAKIIGEHWANNITLGQGRVHNCQIRKHEYPELGIGQVNHSNESALKTLKGVISSYLSKSDCIIQLPSEYGRVLFKGQVQRKSKRGRPRHMRNS
ncbi:hypothetical protein Q672_03850 [Marinobacter sp. EVN1]|nr:hypothetical protein Q672_03850 [Marinobacter sp. EVN1]